MGEITAGELSKVLKEHIRWRHQDKKISEELNKIQLKVTTGTLDPSKEK